MGFSFTVTCTPISMRRKRAIPSISDAGQPWKVESVIWSDSRVRKSTSRNRARSSGIRARSAATSADASFIASIQARTGALFTPARS